ncbi:hypothetical protein KIPB_012395 [Kipferlia bialata]|uniref:Uncharacterized protein n=1 Tax=Kipferlia bialata TaxID=797122 RepID=A0A391P7J2_9EUKA|nr:hypothetical protein KIPB_012395 [Kipferlia bialata]|eukprot:g12395.t1
MGRLTSWIPTVVASALPYELSTEAKESILGHLRSSHAQQRMAHFAHSSTGARLYISVSDRVPQPEEAQHASSADTLSHSATDTGTGS